MARTTGLLAVGGVCLVSLAAFGADPKAEWAKETYTNAKKEQLPYRLFEPVKGDPKTLYPLVVYLHGRGSRGTDNEKQLGETVLHFANKENRTKYPCFIVAPQCSTKEPHDFWAKTVDSGIVMELIKHLEKTHPIDPKRIYVVGVSDGGWGVWTFLERDPGMIAAAIPIAGQGEPKAAHKFASVPIWVFHGVKDNTEPVKSSREMVAALKKAGGNPQYTEYADEGHNVWDKAFHDPKVFEWLFAQKRN